MTFQKLFDLKFKKGVSTIELEKRFPNQRKKISTLALLELPSNVLKKVVDTDKELCKLLELKQNLFQFKYKFPH